MLIVLSTLGMLFSMSNSWARVFDDESVCRGAVILNESNEIIWTTNKLFIEYVEEAKARGLDCGVKKIVVSGISKFNKIKVHNHRFF